MKIQTIDDCRYRPQRAAFAAVLIVSATALASRAPGASQYVQHNLISDIPGIADQLDPNLVNP
jgi:hypothetical protein